ncbi:hypothetical protein [Endozoicomonas lisbonensis]|uniref:Uncharacterized protein n=1 Tax=Endozoicomonas lisbonensis TaxID=3120522 RepID=A0ABV2SG40_9GAMM
MVNQNSFSVLYLKKYLMVILFCSMTISQAASAGDPTQTYGTRHRDSNAIIVWLLVSGSFLLGYSVIPWLGQYYVSIPKITYNEYYSNGKLILEPEISRDGYTTMIWFLASQNTKRAICEPITLINAPEFDSHKIRKKCNQWLSQNSISFPHDIAGVTIDRLNTLLLPKLVYHPNEDRLDFLVTDVTYVDYDNRLFQKIPEVCNVDNLWERHNISFINSYKKSNKSLLLSHEYPYINKKQEARSTSERHSYHIAIPGLLRLHDQEGDYYIATKKSGTDATLCYWKINSHWKQHCKTMRLDEAGTPESVVQ